MVDYDLSEDWRPIYADIIDRLSTADEVPQQLLAQIDHHIASKQSLPLATFVMVLDLARSQILRVSPGIQKLLGLKPDQWAGGSLALIQERIHPLDQARVVELNQQAVADLQSPLVVRASFRTIQNFRFVKASGDPVWVSAVSAPLYVNPATDQPVLMYTTVAEALPSESGLARIAVAYDTHAGQRVQRIIGEDPTPKVELTDRDLSVLRLLAQGNSSREISALLDISHQAVNKHRRRLLERTGTTNSAELVRVAVERGLI